MLSVYAPLAWSSTVAFDLPLPAGEAYASFTRLAFPSQDLINLGGILSLTVCFVVMPRAVHVIGIAEQLAEYNFVHKDGELSYRPLESCVHCPSLMSHRRCVQSLPEEFGFEVSNPHHKVPNKLVFSSSISSLGGSILCLSALGPNISRRSEIAESRRSWRSRSVFR